MTNSCLNWLRVYIPARLGMDVQRRDADHDGHVQGEFLRRAEHGQVGHPVAGQPPTHVTHTYYICLYNNKVPWMPPNHTTI